MAPSSAVAEPGFAIDLPARPAARLAPAAADDGLRGPFLRFLAQATASLACLSAVSMLLLRWMA